MKISADNGDYGLLYDANDRLIDRTYEADTHTGWCIRLIYDENGNVNMRKERHRYLAPLKWIPASEINDNAKFRNLIENSKPYAVPLEVYPYDG